MLVFILLSSSNIVHIVFLAQMLRERNQGYGILVSSVPKETYAFYSLRDPSEVSGSFISSSFLCTYRSICNEIVGRILGRKNEEKLIVK